MLDEGLPPPPASDLAERFRESVLAEGLLKRCTVLVGVSGRADSVGLLHLLHDLADEFAMRLVVTHVQEEPHPECRADAAFVQNLAARLNVSFYGVEEPPWENPDERASGRVRALKRVGSRVRARAIVTGETSDNLAEQFLASLLRADEANADALAASTHDLLRPLLPFTHTEVVQFLAARGILFRSNHEALTLSTNLQRLRLLVLPILRRHVSETAAVNLAAAAQLLLEDRLFVREIAQAARPEVSWTIFGNAVAIDHARWSALPAALRRRILADAAQTVAPSRPPTRALLLTLDARCRHLADGETMEREGLKIGLADGTLSVDEV